MKPILNFCPKCGSELTEKSTESEDWVTCPKCGFIEVEYYQGPDGKVTISTLQSDGTWKEDEKKEAKP